MQPANLSLDPMASLWPSNGSPNSNNYFQSQISASPDQNSSSSSTANAGKNHADTNLAMSQALLPNSQAGPVNLGPNGNQNSRESHTAGVGVGVSNEGEAGDTFMGASTPGTITNGFRGWWSVVAVEELCSSHRTHGHKCFLVGRYQSLPILPWAAVPFES